MQEGTQAWKQNGDTAAAIDLKYDAQTCDILKNLGFLNHVTKILQTELSCLAGPVCSSWGWVNRGTSKRSLGRPLGNMTVNRRVFDANVMVSRVVLLMWLMAAIGICFVIEQPANSLLEAHPRFQHLMKEHAIYKKRIEMKE